MTRMVMILNFNCISPSRAKCGQWNAKMKIPAHLVLLSQFNNNLCNFFDVLKIDKKKPVFIRVKIATRRYMEILLVQHRVTAHEPQYPYFSFHLNHGLCEVLG